ncbi:MAG: glycosyltransferase family 2 protein [Betaproteobacteria bacterium]
MTTTGNAAPAETTTRSVTVLLSTFNGGNFLQQQLNSLYEQTYPGIRIMVRDDGSTDATWSILERAQSEKRIELLVQHDNLGAARSYFELLQRARLMGADFVAFCDQDDVWMPGKLSRAIAALSGVGHERAAMYSSRLEIVGRDLTHVGFTPLPEQVGFGNALVENVCVGCTIVLNRPAIELVGGNLPARALVHDWWCYLTLSCFGEIVYDRDAPIKYRQHGHNTFGAAQGTMDRLKRNLRRFAGKGNGRHWQSEQAAMFMATFGERIPIVPRQLLSRFIGARSAWWPRLRLACSREIWRQRKFDGLVMRVLMMINRY